MKAKDETPDKIEQPPSGETGPPGLSIDWELYGTYLEDSDLTDEEKIEFIRTLWSIMVSFVDLGFRIHALDHVCEQNDEIGDFIASGNRGMIDSSHPSQQEPATGKAHALLPDERRHN